MKMFGKKTEEISYFSEGLTNEGKIKFSGTLKIDGQFSGEIEGLSTEVGGLLSTDFLIIGATAKVKGKISVSKLEVYGTLEGDIFVTGKITIFKSGTVKGSLVSPVVSIQEGATVEMSVNQNKTVLTPGWSDRQVKFQEANLSVQAQLDVLDRLEDRPVLSRILEGEVIDERREAKRAI